MWHPFSKDPDGGIGTRYIKWVLHDPPYIFFPHSMKNHLSTPINYHGKNGAGFLLTRMSFSHQTVDLLNGSTVKACIEWVIGDYSIIIMLPAPSFQPDKHFCDHCFAGGFLFKPGANGCFVAFQHPCGQKAIE